MSRRETLTVGRRIGRPAAALFVLAFGGLTGADALAAQDPPPPPPEAVWEWDPDDPRIGLAPGLHDAGMAIGNLERLVSLPKPDPFLTDEAGGRGPTNSDS
ncbi:MAG: hypothetical protein F4Z59_03840, partial [Gemmatimonadales bacterium]|nr:hypothetical protein [Gemmatimonadales bacterium]